MISKLDYPRVFTFALFLIGLSIVTQIGCGKKSAPAKPERSAAGRQDEVATTTIVADATLAKLPSTKQGATRTSALQEGVKAASDSWPTEAFSEKATKRLKELAKQVPFTKSLDTFVSADFTDCRLRPSDSVLSTKQFGPNLRVRTGSVGAGSMSFDDAMRELFAIVTDKHQLAFKIVRVASSDNGFSTSVLAEGGGNTEKGTMQWNARWQCVWDKDARIRRISVEKYEEVHSDSGRWLVDVTQQVIGDSRSYREQLLYGMDYWVNKLEHRLYVNRLGHHGLAIGDANGDGLEDLYVCQAGGLPNLLYLHKTDGTADESGRTFGVDILDDTTAAIFADMDNDGDQDLVVLTVSGGYVLGNDGNARFSVVATMPDCKNAFSLTAADYNQDGRLDVYVGRYWPDESVRGALPLPVPYFDARNGGKNVLLRNDGDWTFSDVTEQVGLAIDNTRYTMAAAWEDFDNDGDQDLYVANDFGRNCLYRNDSANFVNIADQVGVEDTAAGMSVSWSDFDHDGNQDVYVGNMFSSAGGRITYQNQYRQRFDDSARGKLQRLARGNSLFRNVDGKSFRDVSLQMGATMGRWAWGSMFADLNNDSWDDLVVANGNVTTDDTGDL